MHTFARLLALSIGARSPARKWRHFQNKMIDGKKQRRGELSGVIVQSPWCAVCQAGSSRSSRASMARRRRRTFRTLQQSRDAPQAWGTLHRKTAPPGGGKAVSRADLVSPPLPSLASSCLCRDRHSFLRRRHRRCRRRSPSVAIVTYLRFVASERHKGGGKGEWRGFCSHGLVRVARGLVATG